MKSIWSGAISFGIIHIPVKLYPATTTTRLDLDYLHKDDLCPVGYEYVCKNTGEKVSFEDIVRGYEYKEGEYVVLTEEDFEKANIQRTKTIQVEHFVELRDIDPEYFVKPYHVTPENGSTETYTLFHQALNDTQKVAVCEYVLRDRERLGILKPAGNAIQLVQMRYVKELRGKEDLDIPEDTVINRDQLELSKKLIEQLTVEYDPARYKDDYITELRSVIEQKAKGRAPRPKGQAPVPTDIDELMEQLQKSLEIAQRARRASQSSV